MFWLDKEAPTAADLDDVIVTFHIYLGTFVFDRNNLGSL